ncbi:hypothetical protein C2S52_014574 [Perilla frutescens var. hirtella]|nr:hypothetical protein C2S52_014574 [Perilla frutescens var. hirtella]
MEPQKPTISILMFPWLAHGHIFPYLELSRALLNRKNLHIYLCTTSINFDSIKNFIDKHSLHNSIKLVELELEPSPDLPPHYHTTKNLPQSLKFTLIKAFQTSKSSFSGIITTLKPDLVMYDLFQPWAAKVAASQGIPSLHFSIFGAVPLAFMHHLHTFGEAAAFPFPAIQFENRELKSLLFLTEFLYQNINDVDQDYLFGNFKQSCDIVLLKTSRGIEEKYIDYLSTMSEKKIVPLGPLITHNTQTNEESSDIIQWLNKKKQHSTLFISFGSEYFLSAAEIAEIAKGLELCSSVNFIWIIRSPSGASADEALPRGFVERVSERGLVVTGWAPQGSILGHENTGGFVSHCGWSSVMESLYFGVPVVAMPMKVDQPINARMLVEAGSCVEVSRSGNDGVFEGEEIARAIEKVMAEESGGGLRRRARELSATLKMEEEAVLDEAAEQVWRLCLKKRADCRSNK